MKNKTFEQRKFKRKETLGQYLHRRIKSGDEVNTTFHLIKVPSTEEIDFYILQYRTKEGHSEWPDRFQRNFWVEDEN